ncbi:MAG TPA: hypothetical protein VMA36_06830 [Candidatus Limnocylindria bacterium]|jgi:hypothetical protein|nr:hypothetical protein [Candidatus Limnocylindria bacterium]
MNVPDDLDAMLRDLVRDEAASTSTHLAPEDKAFVDHVLASITQGSKGIFVVLHPNDVMQYMLLNTGRAGAIALLARVMQRTAEGLQADPD